MKEEKDDGENNNECAGVICTNEHQPAQGIRAGEKAMQE